MLAVTHNMTRYSLGGGNHLPVDDQDAVIVAGDKAFDDDCAGMFSRLGKSRFSLFRGLQVCGHTAAMVGGNRFHDDRVTDAFRGTNSLAFAVNQALSRYRQPEVAQYSIGLFLVRRKFDGDVAGIAGGGCLDAFLVFAVP